MRLFKTTALLAYGVYAWSSFLVVGGLTLLLLIVTPGLGLRRTIGAYGARTWLTITGMRAKLVDTQLLPAEPVVIVANHSSYIDGVLLKAMLPTRFCFVIKKEMASVPLAGLLLRRIGAEFVDRFNRHSGAMDARRLMRAATKGQSLVFFPEGTFTQQIGLGRFHGGAFVIAARTHMTVVPLAIEGARTLLPPASMWPRPGTVTIRVLSPIPIPNSLSPHAVAGFQRDESRNAILRALSEPDLDANDGVAALASQRTKA